MKRLLNSLPIIAALGLLPGCAVSLHGNQTSGGGSSVTTTSSSLQAGQQFGNARVGASFGTPPPANAAGGQVRFSSGAAAVLVAGLVMIELADAISEWFRPAAHRTERQPAGNISQTCSCYGWQEESMSDPATQQMPVLQR
jgi:hypothetical protein